MRKDKRLSTSSKKSNRKIAIEMESNHEYYQMGVSLRNIFDELDYAYKVFLGLYRYYHSEIRPYVAREDGSVDEESAKKELLAYLSKIRKYDADLARDMLAVLFENRLLEVDYELYKNLLYEVKEAYKVEILQSIDPAVRSNVYFVEGFGRDVDETLRKLAAESEEGRRSLQETMERVGVAIGEELSKAREELSLEEEVELEKDEESEVSSLK